jgi:hypothetical protein
VVTENSYENPLLPRVLLVADAHGRPMLPPLELDLATSAARAMPNVTTVLDPEQAGIDPGQYLHHD